VTWPGIGTSWTGADRALGFVRPFDNPGAVPFYAR
jgi:hypothetical protein